MANDVLKLTWASDNEADAAELNLLDFVHGLTLDEGGWTPQIAQGNQATVTETLTFHARALSHDQLAGYVQVLDDWIYRINTSWNITQRLTVWLTARWKSETGLRRAAIYNLSYSLGSESSPFGVYLRDDSFVPTLTMVITRGAYWEELTQHNITTLTDAVPNISNLGGVAIFGDDPAQTAITVTGDISARIAKASLVHVLGERDYWAGFRTSRFGSQALFEPLWEAEGGDAVDADTSIAADAGASGGSVMLTTFATITSLSRRINIRTAQVTGNYDAQRGLFTVLARAKMSAGIARCRISSGISQLDLTSTATVINPRVTVATNSYTLYDMGTIQIPAIPQRFESDPTVAAASSILLDAERVSGAGSLSIDCFVLIPIAEGFIKTASNIATDTTTIVRTNPDGLIYAYDSGAIGAQFSLDMIDWILPAYNEAPIVVVASQGTTHAISVTNRVRVSYIRRWRTLRGTE